MELKCYEIFEIVASNVAVSLKLIGMEYFIQRMGNFMYWGADANDANS